MNIVTPAVDDTGDNATTTVVSSNVAVSGTKIVGDSTLASMTAVDYLEWANSLLGRDWEIYWVEEEDAGSSTDDVDDDEEAGTRDGDRNEEEEEAEDNDEVTSTTTATGQETAEEQRKVKQSTDDADVNMAVDGTPTESSCSHVEDASNNSAAPASAVENLKGNVTDSEPKGMDVDGSKHRGDNEHDVQDDEEDEGSVIDDWYDGHVIALDKPRLTPTNRRKRSRATKADASSPASAASLAADLKFQVRFEGEEDIYKVSLIPSKVRPSARGWLKRTVALLNADPGQLSGQKNLTRSGWESMLPPDTRTFDDVVTLDQIAMDIMESTLCPPSNNDSCWCSMPEQSKNIAPLPVADDLHRILRLRVQLQSQIVLRTKLAKIENHERASSNANRIRNPTEPYVNHLVQCCKDLDGACEWYCKSWKLLQHFFGTATTDGSRSIGTEEKAQLDQLTFESLMNQYMEFGRDSLVNASAIDVNASSGSSKRRQPVPPKMGGATRRTKRRRKHNIRMDDDLLAYESQSSSIFDDNMESCAFVSHLVRTIEESNRCWYIGMLGNMLLALSHLVVGPLLEWKHNAMLILGSGGDGMDTQLGVQHAGRVTTPRDDSPSKRKTQSKSNREIWTSKTFENKTVVHVQTPDVKSISGESDDVAMNEEVSEDVDVNAVDDNDDGDNSSCDGEVEEKRFCYEEIQDCVATIRNSRVLSRFNLFDDVHKLHAKLHDIEKIEKDATSLLSRLAEDVARTSKLCDGVLIGLKEIVNEMNSPKSTLYNVDPLGKRGSGLLVNITPITRDQILAAAEFREWLLDVAHVKSVRERECFVNRVISQVVHKLIPDQIDLPALARNPSVEESLEQAIRTVTDLSKSIEMDDGTIAAIEENLVVRPVEITDISRLTSQLDSLTAVMSELAKNTVISLVEEKIAARIDVITWQSRASNLLLRLSESAKKTLTLDDVKNLYDNLQQVVRGKASTRTDLLRGVDPNDKVDQEISLFATADVNLLCLSTASEVSKLYTTVISWKERADAALSCLRMHGNKSAGTVLSTQKLPAMVDIKRIDDLIYDDANSPILIPGYVDTFRRIQTEAHEWSSRLQTELGDETRSVQECLSFVESERDRRPRGIVQHPTRTVVDNLVDLLSWYVKAQEAMENVSDTLSRTPEQGYAENIAQEYSSRIIESVYPFLADVAEALEVYCAAYTAAKGVTAQFRAKPGKCLEILENLFRQRKSSRSLSKEKLHCNEMIEIFFSRLLDRDESQGFIFQMMLWFHWHLFVTDFVAPWNDTDRVQLPWETVPSLTAARELRSQEPFVSDNVDMSTVPKRMQVLIATKTTELITFEKLILEAENIELAIKETFAKARDLLRGSLQKADMVREHFSRLKEFLSIVKAREVGNGGLALNSTLETQIEHHIKIFGWLVRTFQYPLLHQNEASYSSSSPESADFERIPWDVLVGLYDKIPNEADGSGDFALCTMRVKDLYAAASKWQDEISRTTMISNRGNKRRAPKSTNPESPAGKVVGQETENAAKLQMQKMELLAGDPILSKVDMPREKAVRSMISNSREFEVQLRNFLAQDYNGANQDKAPFPVADSLVARNGQFILYRLTGSPLFAMMQSSMHSLSCVGNNVFAETPGKAAFDWMSSAVSWIERLQESVTSDSSFPNKKLKLLVIPEKDARNLCSSGEEIFLDTTEDVRQTLSNHGIFISISTLKKKLRVTLKKDGAHHSVGGTVIRWCPILFDALRADVSRLQDWEGSFAKLVDEFNSFFAKTRNDPKEDESNLFRWYSFREKIRMALDEGEQSLVVSPAKSLLDSYFSLQNSIQLWLEQNSTDELNARFARRLYAQSTSLYDDRFRLLDSLLHRKGASLSLEHDTGIEIQFTALDPEKTFRDTCRTSLEGAFRTAAAVLNLSSATVKDVDDLCALKAWEIENEMYELFQEELGISGVSEEYRNKARSLKSNLENANNCDLTLRVLLGDITVSALIKMSPDQLASQKSKIERERAKKAALLGAVLNPATLAEKDTDEVQYQKSSPIKSNPPDVCAKPINSILKMKTPVAVFKLPENEEREEIPDPSFDDDEDADGAPTLDSDELSASDQTHTPSSTETMALSVTSGAPKLQPPSIKPALRLSNTASPGHSISVSTRPPPPPSLAAMKPSIPDTEQFGDRGRGQRISNVLGGSSFRIEIHGSSKFIFQAAFWLEDDSHSDVISNTMPETLKQKGRSKIEDFNQFVSEKLHRGRWNVTILRLTTVTDKDAAVYKQFYKDFEAMERIAMFKLDDDKGSKLFLVTPKFHGAAKRAGSISFSTKTSTYAIVLTKKE